jgi:GDP-L-fucose synthase
MPKLFDLTGKKVFVEGHRGMVGAALLRRLAKVDCSVITAGREQLDLVDQSAVERFFAAAKPDVVIMAAAKVGGIRANSTFAADFIYENIAIESNSIHAAFRSGVGKLLFLSSACTYPRLAEQPMQEDDLLSGPVEPTSEWYAIAKIAGLKMCQAYRRQYGADYIAVTPTNVYGPGDNYHPDNSHVIGALMRRLDDAKRAGTPGITAWGTGKPEREFMFVEDLADACIFALESYSGEQPLNIGTGEAVSIAELAHLIADVVGYGGDIAFDATKPDGAPRKMLDSARFAAMGWKAVTPLRDGLKLTYANYVAGGGRR